MSDGVGGDPSDITALPGDGDETDGTGGADGDPSDTTALPGDGGDADGTGSDPSDTAALPGDGNETDGANRDPSDTTALPGDGGDTDGDPSAENVAILPTLQHVNFLPDVPTPHDDQMPRIREIADILRDIPNVRILISGHTALANTPENRLRFSQWRAQNIANILVELGAVRVENITMEGHGAERPIANNRTAAGMAANRRVEITILTD